MAKARYGPRRQIDDDDDDDEYALSELCGPIPMKVITPVRDARQQ
jgi:hypothetical protein